MYVYLSSQACWCSALERYIGLVVGLYTLGPEEPDVPVPPGIRIDQIRSALRVVLVFMLYYERKKWGRPVPALLVCTEAD